MKLIVGTAPNLPWWRLRSMSDVEIEKFNRGHMVEIEMNNSKYEQEQQESMAEFARKENKPNDTTVATLLEVERIVVWNAAIEAAAMKVGETEDLDEVETRMAIRKLKK